MRTLESDTLSEHERLHRAWIDSVHERTRAVCSGDKERIERAKLAEVEARARAIRG